MYQLKGNPITENVPINLIYDEVGQLLIEKYNKEFKGTPAEHKIKYKTGDTITNSNVPFALGLNQLLLNDSEFKGLDLRVLTPVDIIKYWDKIPERGFTYADSNSIVIYPNVGPNEDLRTQVLQIIEKQNTKVPLIVSNLGVERADDDYGFKFKDSDFQITEAGFLQKEGELALKKGKIVSSEKGIPVYTPDSQSGLRGLYRYGDGLFARDEGLVGSVGYGRVQLVQDPKGLAQSFVGEYIKKLEAEKQRKSEQLEINYKEALKILKRKV